MTSTTAPMSDSDMARQRLRTELARVRAVPAHPATPPKPWRTYSAGSVTVCEGEDFRFWITLQRAKDRDLFNELGALIVRHALQALVNARVVPAWLAFPAGVLRALLGDADAETDAETFVAQHLTNDAAIQAALQTLTKHGLEGIVLGVDDSDNDGWPQVPVKVRWENGKLAVEALARRTDDEVKVPKARRKTRRFGKTTSVFVSYCGEISYINAMQSSSKGVQLGDQQGATIVLDLAHYFRSPSLPREPGQKPRTGINYFMRSCGNGAGRLRAPVIVSTVLVARTPCEDPSDVRRPTFWLATKAPKKGRTPDASCCLAPSEIVVVRDATGKPALTIHLHK